MGWRITINSTYRQDWTGKKRDFHKIERNDTKFFDAYLQPLFFMPSGNPKSMKRKQQPTVPDTAFFVLARIAGENKDRFDTEGDLLHLQEEKAILALRSVRL